jgi:hypothetical protein
MWYAKSIVFVSGKSMPVTDFKWSKPKAVSFWATSVTFEASTVVEK